MLNSKKCHFMVERGTILGYIVSSRGIKVDKAKVNVIKSLSYSSTVQEVCYFLGHIGFY